MFSKGRKKSKPVAAPSIVSSDLEVSGDMVTRGSLQIDGRVIGDITADSVSIGSSGCVVGSILAENLSVFGLVEGELRASKVFLARSGRVTGDIHHERLEIEPGAQYQGSVRRIDGEPQASEVIAVKAPAKGAAPAMESPSVAVPKPAAAEASPVEAKKKAAG